MYIRNYLVKKKMAIFGPGQTQLVSACHNGVVTVSMRALHDNMWLVRKRCSHNLTQQTATQMNHGEPTPGKSSDILLKTSII